MCMLQTALFYWWYPSKMTPLWDWSNVKVLANSSVRRSLEAAWVWGDSRDCWQPHASAGENPPCSQQNQPNSVSEVSHGKKKYLTPGSILCISMQNKWQKQRQSKFGLSIQISNMGSQSTWIVASVLIKGYKPLVFIFLFLSYTNSTIYISKNSKL